MWSHHTFDKLVEDEKDFVGMVAYTIYKNEKLNWIKTFENQNGCCPTKEELDKYFYPSINSEATVYRYSAQAETLLSNFISATTSEEMDAYRLQVRDEVIISTIKKSFWQSVGESLVAAIIASVLIAAFSTAFWLYGEMQNSKRLEQLIREAPIAEEIKKELLSPK